MKKSRKSQSSVVLDDEAFSKHIEKVLRFDLQTDSEEFWIAVRQRPNPNPRTRMEAPLVLSVLEYDSENGYEFSAIYDNSIDFARACRLETELAAREGLKQAVKYLAPARDRYRFYMICVNAKYRCETYIDGSDYDPVAEILLSNFSDADRETLRQFFRKESK